MFANVATIHVHVCLPMLLHVLSSHVLCMQLTGGVIGDGVRGGRGSDSGVMERW